MNQTILIADDSPTILSTLTAILKPYGYDIVTAEDGVEAAKKAFRLQPNLIISDIEMPKMNGYQLCRLLKNDASVSDIPIVILTSRSSAGSKYWGYETGANRYLTKNFESEKLIETIQQLLPITHDRNAPQIEISEDEIVEKINTFLDDKLFEMTIINQVSKIALAHNNYNEVINALFDIISNVADVSTILIATLSKDQVQINAKIWNETSEDFLQTFELHVLQDLMELTKKQIPEMQIDIDVDGKVGDIAVPFEVENIHSIELKTKEQTFGMISCYASHINAFDKHTKKLLNEISGHISLALENVMMYEQIRKLSIIDGLTEIYNRRHGLDLFGKECERAIRYEFPLSIVMIDIDDFKQINDTKGHLSGDIILKNLSEVIRKCIRSIDIPVRYGGEEFLAILPETAKMDGVMVAERIRKQVEEHAFYSFFGEKVNVTISLGIAEIAEIDSTMTSLELIRLADSRMYKAKKAGKNQVFYE